MLKPTEWNVNKIKSKILNVILKFAKMQHIQCRPFLCNRSIYLIFPMDFIHGLGHFSSSADSKAKIQYIHFHTVRFIAKAKGRYIIICISHFLLSHIHSSWKVLEYLHTWSHLRHISTRSRSTTKIHFVQKYYCFHTYLQPDLFSQGENTLHN